MGSNCAPAEASSYVERWCGYKTSMRQTLSHDQPVACYVLFSAIWIGDSETKPKEHKEILFSNIDQNSSFPSLDGNDANPRLPIP